MPMQAMRRVAISDATLYSSSAAEADFGAWAAATAYAVGDRVIRATTHRVYERLIAGTTAAAPEADPVNWLDVAPTNRWAMFSDSPSAATSAASPLSVYLTPGAVNDIVITGLIGTQVQVYSGATGAILVRTVAVPAPVPPATTRTVVISGLGIAAGNRIGVVITGGATVQCAALLLGTLVTLGQALPGCEVGITDYSVVSTDDFGATSITVRPYSRWITGTYRVDAGSVDATLAQVESLLGSVTWWSVDSGYDCLQTLGWPKNHQLTYRGAGYSVVSFRLEGLSRDDAVVQAGEVVPDTSGLVLQTAQLMLYQRSALQPAAPTAAVTYTFASAIMTGLTAGWQSTIPSGSDPLWVITATAASNARSVVLRPIDWSAVARLVQDGAAGPAGAVATPNLLRGAQVGPFSTPPATYGTLVAVLKDGATNPYGLQPGEPLAFSADVWADAALLGAGEKATLILYCQTAAGGWTLGLQLDGKSTTRQRAADTMTLPAGAADMVTVAIGLYHLSDALPNTNTGTAYADRLQVQRGTVATAYMPGVQDGAPGSAGPAGPRGSVEAARSISGSAWSDTEAATAIAAAGYGSPVALDRVTLYSGTWAESRFYTGAAWLTWSAMVNGNLLVTGTVGADKLAVSQLSAITATIGTLRSATSGARLEVTTDVIRVYDTAGTLRVKLGNLA